MPIVGVRIASLLANPEGVDEGKESITLINQATTTIDLSGMEAKGSGRRRSASFLASWHPMVARP